MRELVVAEAARPIRNVLRNSWTYADGTGAGNIGNGVGMSSFVFDTAVKMSGAGSWRRDRTSAEGAGFGGRRSVMYFADTGAKVGDVVRWRARVMHNNPTELNVRAYWEAVGGTYTGGNGGPGITIPPNVPTTVEGEITLTTTHVEVASRSGFAAGVLFGAVADPLTSVWYLSIMGTLNQPLPPLVHCDGDTPGWRWYGTPGASASAGYPYTLESIAGMPLSVNTTQNSQIPTPINWQGGPFDGFSLYAVSDTLSLGPIAVIAGVGSAPGVNGVNGAVILRSASNDQSLYNNRVAPVSGSGIIQGYGSGQRTIGRHVHASTVFPIGDGRFRYVGSVDNGPEATNVGDVSGGYPSRSLSLSLTGGGLTEQPRAAYLFDKFHPTETRIQIVRWLANVYGGSVS